MNETDHTISNLYTNEQNYFGHKRPEMVALFPSQAKRALDVGCSNGIFGLELKKKYNAEVWGVDINNTAIAEAKKRLDQAHCFDLTKNMNELKDNYFDVIYFNDVLEHLVDPYTLLRDIKSKLTDKGQVIASIPNIRYFRVLDDILFKKDFKYQNDGVLDRTHLRFFTKKSIIRMFEESGYKINEVTPINKTRSLRPLKYFFLSLGLFGSDVCYPQFAIKATKRG